MFDATAGRQVSTQKIDQLTNRFAAEFEDRMKDFSMSEQEALVEKLVEVMSGLDTARSFATNSVGQPAAALGSSSSSVTNDTGEAIRVILADTGLDAGFKHLIRRGYDQSAPDHIEVEADGTPKALRTTERQRDAEKAAKEAAVRELAEQRDANHNGSLAHQLAAALNAAATPTDAVAKATVQPLIEAVEQAAGQLETHLMTSHIDGIDDLNTAIVAAKSAVS